MRNLLIRKSGGLLLLLVLFVSFDAHAQRRVVDHIETEIGAKENKVTVLFNVPVRYVSNIINSKNNEIDVTLVPVITPGSEEDFLGSEEVVTWRATAEIPLERVVFRGELVGTSSLRFSFGSSIGSYAISPGGDQFSLVLQLKKDKVIEAVKIDTGEAEEPIKGVEKVPPTLVGRSAKAKKKVADGGYVINLLSQTVPIDFSRIPPVPIGPDKRMYGTVATIKGREWNRLRVGFFASEKEAKAALKELKNLHPQAWIDLASPEEKAAFFATAKGKKGRPIQLPNIDRTAPADARMASMMASVRKVMTAGDYPRAIRMLTAVLEEQTGPYEQEARELLGLARERNGQFAHANAEYTKYLEKYPEGEDADRVRQRLAGLVTAEQAPKKKLRKVKERKRPDDAPWDVYGSISQFFREDRIDSEFVDDEDSVTRSQIDTNIDLTARKRTSAYDMRAQLSGGYELDLLSDGPGNESSLSAAYLDFEHYESNVSGRFGRQRFRSSGILNRFDGGVVGYRFNDDVKVNVYAGIPVERSSDTFIREDKHFYGMNAELSSLFKNVDVTLFGLEQRVDGLVDRRAIGAEARYFDDKRSVFGLVDYDIHYGELNTLLLQTNWTVRDDLRLYANYDYRTSPILTTSNALQSQTVTTIEALQDSYTDDEIYDLAEDRTATSHVVSVGGTWSRTQDLQFSGDLTLSRISDTPASGGVEATEETGSELFYTAQVIKNNLIKEGDIGIFSLRYADTMSSDTVTLTANSRYPVTNLWRIKPRVTVSYRENKDNDDTRLQIGGLFQTEYRYRRDLIFEMELGANWYDESSSTSEEDFVDYFFGLGYRWTF